MEYISKVDLARNAKLFSGDIVNNAVITGLSPTSDGSYNYIY